MAALSQLLLIFLVLVGMSAGSSTDHYSDYAEETEDYVEYHHLDHIFRKAVPVIDDFPSGTIIKTTIGNIPYTAPVEEEEEEHYILETILLAAFVLIMQVAFMFCVYRRYKKKVVEDFRMRFYNNPLYDDSDSQALIEEIPMVDMSNVSN